MATADPHTSSVCRAGAPWIIGLLALLVAARVPFYFTGHVQEDAFISWHCARNLADTGVYGLNPGEKVSASTSHAYVLMTASIIKIFGDHFIPVVLAVNTVLFEVGLYLICSGVFSDRRRCLLLWVAASLIPVSLLSSYAGMETGLLLFLVGMTIRWGPECRAGARLSAAAAFFLLSWTRPDAIALGGLVLIYLLWLTRRWPVLMGCALLTGTAALALFNKVYFGTVLNQTIIAKSVCYHPSHAIGAVVERLRVVFIGRDMAPSIFSPLATHFLIRLGPLFLLPLILAAAVCALGMLQTAGGKLLALLMAAAVLLPLPYAWGGIMFPWYFWPSAVFGGVAVLAVVVDWLCRRTDGPRRWGVALLWIVLALLAVGQWCLSVNKGVQSFCGTHIGQTINQISASTDTLLLEPAGYIPFYARRYTWDEVGLGSPEVTEYQRRLGDAWWTPFIRDKKPRFIVQRQTFADESRLFGGYQLSAAERQWFDSEYERVQRFVYDPRDYYHSPLLLRICGLGADLNYDLYRLRSGR